jgi:hypothetical protein
MFDQSYQQLYLEKQLILQGQPYPCPRCKCGNLESFGETETFFCTACGRNFVAINAGRILYPVYQMKTKIAPVFWWDGLHWHLAGTTASIRQTICTALIFVLPLLLLDGIVVYFNNGHAVGQASKQAFWLNLSLLNLLVGLFLAQLFYLACWDHEGRKKRTVQQNSQYKH